MKLPYSNPCILVYNEKPGLLIGRHVKRKFFNESDNLMVDYIGEITRFFAGSKGTIYWHILYPDADEEDLNLSEVLDSLEPVTNVSTSDSKLVGAAPYSISETSATTTTASAGKFNIHKRRSRREVCNFVL